MTSEFLPGEILLRSAMAESEPMEWVDSISTEVPGTRPEKFITLGRTGGETTQHQDRPQVAIQCWHKSRWEAEQLASKVKAWLYNSFAYHPNISLVEVAGSYEFRDPEGRQYRWQVLVNFRSSAN